MPERGFSSVLKELLLMDFYEMRLRSDLVRGGRSRAWSVMQMIGNLF